MPLAAVAIALGPIVVGAAAASRREFIRASKDDAALSMCESVVSQRWVVSLP
jgi:hypothetical protein